MLLSPTLTLTLQCRIFFNPLRKILVLKKLAPLQIFYKFTKKKNYPSHAIFSNPPLRPPSLSFSTRLKYVSFHIFFIYKNMTQVRCKVPDLILLGVIFRLISTTPARFLGLMGMFIAFKRPPDCSGTSSIASL
jgi:hypothetical protein